MCEKVDFCSMEYQDVQKTYLLRGRQQSVVASIKAFKYLNPQKYCHQKCMYYLSLIMNYLSFKLQFNIYRILIVELQFVPIKVIFRRFNSVGILLIYIEVYVLDWEM